MNRSIFKLVYDINLEHRRCNSPIEEFKDAAYLKGSGKVDLIVRELVG